MKVFTPDADLLAVAARVVWFRTPTDTLARPYYFLAHVMTFGTLEDLKVVMPRMQRSDWIDALQHAPPGIFDARSWAYWHLFCGRKAPPMPQRFPPEQTNP